MPADFSLICPGCRCKLRLSAEALGKAVRCPKCAFCFRAKVKVPGAGVVGATGAAGTGAAGEAGQGAAEEGAGASERATRTAVAGGGAASASSAGIPAKALVSGAATARAAAAAAAVARVSANWGGGSGNAAGAPAQESEQEEAARSGIPDEDSYDPGAGALDEPAPPPASASPSAFAQRRPGTASRLRESVDAGSSAGEEQVPDEFPNQVVSDAPPGSLSGGSSADIAPHVEAEQAAAEPRRQVARPAGQRPAGPSSSSASPPPESSGSVRFSGVSAPSLGRGSTGAVSQGSSGQESVRDIPAGEAGGRGSLPGEAGGRGSLPGEAGARPATTRGAPAGDRPSRPSGSAPQARNPGTNPGGAAPAPTAGPSASGPRLAPPAKGPASTGAPGEGGSTIAFGSTDQGGGQSAADAGRTRAAASGQVGSPSGSQPARPGSGSSHGPAQPSGKSPHRPAKPAKPESDAGDAHDQFVGRRLGQYQIVRRLGRGAKGIVYEAEDVLLGRQVAVKILAPEVMAGGQAAVKRFLLEARAASKLDHPNCVTVYNIGQEDGVVFFSMPMIKGRSALDALEQDGPLPAVEATRIVRLAALGLNAAHKLGIIHRDVKPGNIMLSTEGEVRVADFGMAKVTDNAIAGLTEPGRWLGTPHYMSPEQCQGLPVDPRADVYSLGATYYCLLAGRPPFADINPMAVVYKQVTDTHPDPRTIRHDVPGMCVKIIDKAMAKQKEYRYATAEDMAKALELIENSLRQSAVVSEEAERKWDGRTDAIGDSVLGVLLGDENSRQEDAATRADDDNPTPDFGQEVPTGDEGNYGGGGGHGAHAGGGSFSDVPVLDQSAYPSQEGGQYFRADGGEQHGGMMDPADRDQRLAARHPSQYGQPQYGQPHGPGASHSGRYPAAGQMPGQTPSTGGRTFNPGYQAGPQSHAQSHAQPGSGSHPHSKPGSGSSARASGTYQPYGPNAGAEGRPRSGVGNPIPGAPVPNQDAGLAGNPGYGPAHNPGYGPGQNPGYGAGQSPGFTDPRSSGVRRPVGMPGATPSQQGQFFNPGRGSGNRAPMPPGAGPGPGDDGAAPRYGPGASGSGRFPVLQPTTPDNAWMDVPTTVVLKVRFVSIQAAKDAWKNLAHDARRAMKPSIVPSMHKGQKTGILEVKLCQTPVEELRVLKALVFAKGEFLGVSTDERQVGEWLRREAGKLGMGRGGM